MSFIVPVISAIGAIFATKTAIDAISEGKIGKAILGGVGAYMGFSTAIQGASQLGLELGAAKNIAEGSTTGNLLNPLNATAGNAVTGQSALESAIQAANAGDAGFVFGTEGAVGGGFNELAGGLIDGAGTGIATSGASPGVFDAAMGAVGQSGGMSGMLSGGGGSMLGQFGDRLGDVLSGIGDFARENGALMQVAGQGIAGYAQAKSQEEQMRRLMEEKRRLAEEEIRRRGGAVDIGMSGYRYDPVLRQLVPTGGA